MNLCDDGHDEICYDGRNCPFCEMMASKDATIDELFSRVSELETQVKSQE